MVSRSPQFSLYIKFSSIADGTREKSLRNKSADREAREVVRAVERGGEGICLPDTLEGLLMYGFKGVNPICDEVARWASGKLGVPITIPDTMSAQSLTLQFFRHTFLES